MRYLAVLMFVVVSSGLVGCDGSGGLGLGGGRIEPFVRGNCWYEGGIKDTFAHGKGEVYCLIQGQGEVKKIPMTDFCYGDMKPCAQSGSYSGAEYSGFDRVYDGEWKDGKYHGQGTHNYAGERYVGEFKDGKYHGQGTFSWIDGRKYVGEFKDGNQHGQGTSYNPDGSVRRKGLWCNGEKSDGPCPDFNGQGTFTYPDGGKYVGEYKDGKEHGQGTYTLPNGDKYVGEWVDGATGGQGTYTKPDGRKWEGYWRYDWSLESDYFKGTEYGPSGAIQRDGYLCGDDFVFSTKPCN